MNDSISKQNVIDTIKDADVFVFYGEDITVEDAIEIAIRSTKGSVITDIEQLPLAQPEQKTGKWTYNIDDIFPMDSQMECDNCHASYPIYLCNEFKFCPNCGAKMER